MNHFLPSLFAFTALVMVPQDRVASPVDALQASGSTDLMAAIRTSAVADIYIVGRNFEYPMDLRPYDVRSLGCAYRIYRESPQWADFEQRLAAAEIRILPGTMRQDVRIGLVLSDELGTVWETYSNDLDWPNGLRPGVTQRRRVEISPGFANALKTFVTLHPELALPDSERAPRCPRAAR